MRRVIRTATIDDLQDITEVEALCFPAAEAASSEDLKKRLMVYPEHFVLLFIEDELVSFVDGMVTDEPDLQDIMYEDASLHDPSGKWQMIFGVNTIPSYRRRGYAGMLIRKLIDMASAEGRKGVVLTCKEELISYYSAFGFVNEGLSGSVHGDVTWYQMRISFDTKGQ